jgi:hypothetical protein
MSGAIPGIPAYISVDNRTLNLERILEGIVAQSLIDVILRTCRCGLYSYIPGSGFIERKKQLNTQMNFF